MELLKQLKDGLVLPFDEATKAKYKDDNPLDNSMNKRQFQYFRKIFIWTLKNEFSSRFLISIVQEVIRAFFPSINENTELPDLLVGLLSKIEIYRNAPADKIMQQYGEMRTQLNLI
jgi:hypothetical protein